MTFIDSYEDQLVDAARRQRDARVGRRARRFGRFGVPRGRGPAIALAALVIGVPAATATVAGWNPFDDGDRNPRMPAPTTSGQAVDPDLVATLGVLDRPQSGADRGVATSRAARAFSSSAGYRGAQLKGVRVLDAGRGIVLIPFERGPVPLDPQGRPVPGFDPASYTNVACLFVQSGDSFAGVGCHNAEKIRSGRAIGSGSGQVTGLVPDGVATVRLIRGGQTSEVAVRNNLFVAEGVDAPREVEWLAEDGSTVKRIDLTAPPPGAGPPPPRP
jgi:hypothetical protein